MVVAVTVLVAVLVLLMFNGEGEHHPWRLNTREDSHALACEVA